MKTIEFAKSWRWPTSPTSYEQYPAGAKPTVSDDRAAAAEKAGVLKGEPAAPPKKPSAD